MTAQSRRRSITLELQDVNKGSWTNERVLTERSVDNTTFRYYGSVVKHIRRRKHRLRVSFVTSMMKIDASGRTIEGQSFMCEICFQTVVPILCGMRPRSC